MKLFISPPTDLSKYFLGLALFVIATLFSTEINAQKETEIINKLRIALRDCALDQPEPPVVAKGTINIENITCEGIMYYHKPNFRLDMSFQGVTFIRVNNDTVQWEYDPFNNRHSIQQVNKEEFEQRSEEGKASDFASKELLNYKKLKNKLIYKGEQEIDSVDTYVLELTLKNNDLQPITFYISKRTNLIYKNVMGKKVQWFSNYKSVGSYVYPTIMAYNDGESVMSMNFSEVTIGDPIAESIFRVPEKAYIQVNEFNNKITRLLAAADSLLSNIQYDAAISRYSEILNLDSHNYKAFNGRGLTKVYLGKHYEAITDLNMAIEIDGSQGSAFNNRGLAKYYIGDTKGAIADYSEAIKLDSSLSIAYKNRGLIRLRQGEYEEAIADYSQAIPLRPTDGDLFFKIGIALAQLDKYEEALASYKKAIELNTVTDEVYNYLGVSQFKLEMYDEAEASFREAIKKNEENLQYLDNLGRTLFYAGKYKSAQLEFENYLQKDAKNAEISNLVGLCKYKDEDFKGAIKEFTKAIELDDVNAVYYENRADAKEQIQDYVGAISDYTESISRNPTDASTFYKRGLVKILSSKKLEGCLDLGTAKDMKYEASVEAIMKHCN